MPGVGRATIPGNANGLQSPSAPNTAPAAGATMAQYNPANSTLSNAQGMLNNQNQNYQGFLSNLPKYQTALNNQAVDQGAASYNAQKQQIDQSANDRGLLYSGMKQGAEANAANQAASQTQNQIMQNNMNLQNYATGMGNQVAQNNIGYIQGNALSNAQQAGYDAAQNAQNQSQLGQILGGAASIGAIAAFSDKNKKENIAESDKPTDEMLDKVKAASFNYKDDPEKSKVHGVMAQDLEKSPMGKTMVIETPQGKAIDIPKALTAMLAAQSVLHKRLKKAGA